MRDDLIFLYGADLAPRVHDSLKTMMSGRRIDTPARVPDQSDCYLITYPDQIQDRGRPPLAVLDAFLSDYLVEVFSGVHLLPFFPSSSDDGFAVSDYTTVAAPLGDWDHIRLIGNRFHLLFEFVLNHISSQSSWFQDFRQGDARYSDFFIVPSGWDLSEVFRPRALPLLTPVQTVSGEKRIWTTFSADQIDLNYGNPDVLITMVKILLFYVEQGAGTIRLSAAPFLWKETGSPCLNMEQTHRLLRVFRAVLDECAPGVMLLTSDLRTDRSINGAQGLIGQDALPALVLNAYCRGDAETLTRWIGSIDRPEDLCYNYLGSHDGIGLLPVQGLLDSENLDFLADQIRSAGGSVSYASSLQGDVPFELNCTYFDALHDLNPEYQVRKFLSSQAMLLALAGIPGVYIHSLLGSSNWVSGVRQSGINRRINRRKFDLTALKQALSRSDSIPARIFHRYVDLLRVRTAHSAFHPRAGQRVLPAQDAVFSFVRQAEDLGKNVLCLFNTAPHNSSVRLDRRLLGLPAGSRCTNLLPASFDQAVITWRGDLLQISLQAYQFAWIEL